MFIYVGHKWYQNYFDIMISAGKYHPIVGDFWTPDFSVVT